ncbi:MgtC/SapB transporter [Acidimicrobium ferrooxidans DSM 10331]|uniref:MgtC/SapB transporter n=1 Tax=Acidimicrobium ferrooxidans (strain DSM 10331 / JCM 15462 / NBRC 103882 / ICP) TaxID=525909 RepID=C7M239_ACIFD|nr:MgtC/SapB family protein [Acidimicrobium ferrooxidans]ACU53137.1 MgtC/SapB transporter [Acidimicrobium ferrooxidans DSM 10331]
MRHLAAPLVPGVTWTFLVRSVLAALFGAIVGAERQWRSRMAGLRTNALVALGAALFEQLSLLLATSPIAATAHESVDFTRVTAYIVSGIGFLGAGVIIRDGVNVRGINTAATIWCAAAIGALTGTGYLMLALLAALTVLAAHVGLRPLARTLDRRPQREAEEVRFEWTLSVVCQEPAEAHIRALITQAASAGAFRLRGVRSQELRHEPGLVLVEADLVAEGQDDLAVEQAISRLSLEPAVSSVSWRSADSEARDASE